MASGEFQASIPVRCRHDAVKKTFFSFPCHTRVPGPMRMHPVITLIMSSEALYEEALEQVARNGQMD
jgi:hypothetical protein